MSTKTTKSLLYCAAILLVLVSFNDGNNAEKSSCQAEKELNSIVNIKASKANSPSTKVVAGLKLQNESLCMKSCCTHSDCTLYVFYDSSNRPTNCFLLQCTPTSECVRSSLAGSVVGVIERNDLIHAGPVSKSHVDSSKLRTISTVTSKDGVMLETTLSETPIGSTSSSVQQLEQRGKSPESNSSALQTIKTTAPSTVYHHSSATSIQATTQTASHETTHEATTQVKAQEKLHPTEGHNHTNKTSLVIALFFGILFLLAVVVIVGRPWWDFMHRPRYSKVDYLMNGL